MANYDAAVRPVENSSLPLTVIFGVSLHHIIDVVSKNICSATEWSVLYYWINSEHGETHDLHQMEYETRNKKT